MLSIFSITAPEGCATTTTPSKTTAQATTIKPPSKP
jgi:hypothetical protein